MTSTSHIGTPTRRTVRKAVRGAAIGNTVEWFDFAIYSVLATYIADKFFPSGNDTVALLNTFAIFAAAFFMRPLGGLLLRAAGGPDRPPARAGDRDPADVGLDVRDRSRAELRHHRCGRATAAAASPLPARLFGGRRVRQRRVLPGRVRAGQAPRLRCLVPGVVGRRRLPAGIDHRHRAAGGALRERHELVRLAHSVPARGRARQRRALHPAAPARHP